MSPCVDHIVPLNHKANTRHGHTLENVQIAHRKCNEAKGCSIACPSLFECSNPRLHVREMSINQTPPGVGKAVKNDFLRKTPRALDANIWGVTKNGK